MAWAKQADEKVIKVASENCKHFPDWDPRAPGGGGGVRSGHKVEM